MTEERDGAMERATEVVALMIAERDECESYRGKDNPEPFHRECVKYPDGCQCWNNALAVLKGTSP